MPTVALWEKYHYWERLPIMFYSTPVVIFVIFIGGKHFTTQV